MKKCLPKSDIGPQLIKLCDIYDQLPTGPDNYKCVLIEADKRQLRVIVSKVDKKDELFEISVRNIADKTDETFYIVTSKVSFGAC